MADGGGLCVSCSAEKGELGHVAERTRYIGRGREEPQARTPRQWRRRRPWLPRPEADGPRAGRAGRSGPRSGLWARPN
jgi:hypothetical protein